MIRVMQLATVALAAALLTAGAANARDGHRHRVHSVVSRRSVILAEIKAPPLTVVKQRSFLDPGNVVAVGAENGYVIANTTEHRPIYNSYAPARFGESTLPGRFDLPGNERFEPNNSFDFSPF